MKGATPPQLIDLIDNIEDTGCELRRPPLGKRPVFPTPAIDAFNRGDHQPDGTVVGKNLLAATPAAAPVAMEVQAAPTTKYVFRSNMAALAQATEALNTTLFNKVEVKPTTSLMIEREAAEAFVEVLPKCWLNDEYTKAGLVLMAADAHRRYQRGMWLHEDYATHVLLCIHEELQYPTNVELYRDVVRMCPHVARVTASAVRDKIKQLSQYPVTNAQNLDRAVYIARWIEQDHLARPMLRQHAVAVWEHEWVRMPRTAQIALLAAIEAKFTVEEPDLLAIGKLRDDLFECLDHQILADLSPSKSRQQHRGIILGTLMIELGLAAKFSVGKVSLLAMARYPASAIATPEKLLDRNAGVLSQLGMDRAEKHRTKHQKKKVLKAPAAAQAVENDDDDDEDSMTM